MSAQPALLPLRQWAVRQALLIAALLVVVYDWGTVVLWHQFGLPQDPDQALDAQHPGFREVVAFLREHRHVRVRTLPYELHAEGHQRLMEMLYPIEVHAAPTAAMQAGDVVVLPAGTPLGRTDDLLFTAGALRVVQVR